MREGMTDGQLEFIKSYDFMRLGQAINHESWAAAGMAAQRMRMKAEELELADFSRLLQNLKLAVARREKKSCLDILAQITAKRVQLLKNQL
jgi:hypothetical protein